MEVVKQLAKVDLVNQRDPKAVLSKIMYINVGVSQRDIQNDNLDVMWTVAFNLPKPKRKWSGYMQMLQEQELLTQKTCSHKSCQLTLLHCLTIVS